MNDDNTMFRRAECQVAFGDDKPETFYLLEVRPNGFINTNRLCETMEEAINLQNEVGHGSEPKGSQVITFAERYLRMTSVPGTLKIIDTPL